MASGVPITTSATLATCSLSVQSIAVLQTNSSSAHGLDVERKHGPQYVQDEAQPKSSRAATLSV